MKKYIRLILSALAIVIVFTSLSDIEAAKRRFVTMGTGGVTGVYYPTGGAISKMINAKRKELGIRMSVESTGGSVYNINALLSGDLDFGIAQSDIQYQAVKGMGEWDGRPQNNLRFVMGLHPEIVTLIASEESGIQSLNDLVGKRVNIGNPGSGNRANAIDIFNAAGIDWESDIKVESLKAAEAPRMVQDGRLDAFFYTVGHPNGAISEATSGRRKVRFVSIDGLDDFINGHPFYTKVSVPTDLYPLGLADKSVNSIGVITTLLTSDSVDEDIVYAVVKEVYENFDEFKRLHPALERLTPADMLRGQSAPLHPGADRFYREAGLID